MSSKHKWGGAAQGLLPAVLLLALSCALSAGLSGCGTPASPQPPSLKLPVPVSDLTAERAGDAVTLHWTTTRKTTDRLLIEGVVRAQICREAPGSNASRSAPSGSSAAGSNAIGCEPVGEAQVQPGVAAKYQHKLPAALLSGEPRVVRYFVELENSHGRSAGPSNTAAILAGAAPAAIAGLSAQVRPDGVALHWQPESATAVRLHRTLLTPPVKSPRKDKSGKSGNPLKPSAEPVDRNLWVDGPASGTLDGSLDATARFGESYAYAAQRVARVTVDGQVLELGGPLSGPVRVDVVDRFPPAVPRDLAAVAAAEERSIDLSWTPDTDADLAGYIVYRNGGEGSANDPWVRVSGPKPVVPAAWRDMTATPGTSYRYRVTAIDQTGHESAPSDEARETLPKS